MNRWVKSTVHLEKGNKNYRLFRKQTCLLRQDQIISINMLAMRKLHQAIPIRSYWGVILFLHGFQLIRGINRSTTQAKKQMSVERDLLFLSKTWLCKHLSTIITIIVTLWNNNWVVQRIVLPSLKSKQKIRL